MDFGFQCEIDVPLLNAKLIFIIVSLLSFKNMATFTNRPATTGSFLSRLMAKTSADAADVLRFVVENDNDDDGLSSLHLHDGCDDDDWADRGTTFIARHR